VWLGTSLLATLLVKGFQQHKEGSMVFFCHPTPFRLSLIDLLDATLNPLVKESAFSFCND
jgi:hypothetical protein